MADKPTIGIEFGAIIVKPTVATDGTVSGAMRPGFLDWAAKACQDKRLVVYPTRPANERQLDGMQEWLWAKLGRHVERHDELGLPFLFRFIEAKPRAAESCITGRQMASKRWEDL